MSNRAAAANSTTCWNTHPRSYFALTLCCCCTLNLQFLYSRLSCGSKLPPSRVTTSPTRTQRGHHSLGGNSVVQWTKHVSPTLPSLWRSSVVHCADRVFVVHCVDRATMYPSSLGPPLATWGNMNHTCPR